MSLKDHPMTELLKRAVHCHGGLARWEQLSTLAASMSITGAIWAPKGQPDAPARLAHCFHSGPGRN